MSKEVKEGLAALEAHVKSGERKSEIERLKEMPGYVVKSAAEVLKANPEKPTEVWGGICLENDLVEIIGPSGIGKSRIMLNLAVRQCLADTKPLADEDGTPIACEFAGLPLYRGKVKWLLLGTENGMYRYHYDLSHMTRNCSPEQIETLGERLFMSTLEGDGDTYMAVDGLAASQGNGNFEKLRATIARIQPDILVFDPWGDIIGGSELDDKVVRETIATLRLLRQGIKDRMTIVIVNHSRLGLAENLKAGGLDGANFGKNSKALYTISRCAWNLCFLEDDLNSKIIAFINSKRSNGKKFDPRAVMFNDETMSYETTDINVEERMNELRNDSSRPTQNKTNVRRADREKKLKDGSEVVMKLVADRKVVTQKVIDLELARIDITNRAVELVLTNLQETEGLTCATSPEKSGGKLWGRKEDITNFVERMKAEIAASAEGSKAAKKPKKKAKKRK